MKTAEDVAEDNKQTEMKNFLADKRLSAPGQKVVSSRIAPKVYFWVGDRVSIHACYYASISSVLFDY
jgi:hypothetical protein